MKLMRLPHIAILPYLTCNFRCPYCVVESPVWAFTKWEAQFEDTVTFLNSIGKKAIMVSGGEPFIWKRWGELIRRTDHYWYFCTNTSKVPKWLQDSTAKEKVKLFLAAFHRTGIQVRKFIANVHKVQDLGYPVFVKVVYVGDSAQFNDIEEIIKAGIPASFAPLLGIECSEQGVADILPYCQSTMYANRFFPPDAGAERAIKPCPAGTEESFEIEGSVIVRCSHYSDMLLNRVPRLLRRFRPRYLGDISHPRFHKQPKICFRKTCACEWHTFSDMAFGFENEKWQHFIETKEWTPATILDIKEFVARASNEKVKVVK